MQSLDIDALRALILVADLRSFTRAAEALATSQSAISLRLKRLEARLDRQLVERSPRRVRLTSHGAALVERARSVIAAHDAALEALDGTPSRPLLLGVSDHAAGYRLADILRRVRARAPTLHLQVEVGMSVDLIAAYDAGKLDAIIVRREGNGRDERSGEVLMRDPLRWVASPSLGWRRGESVPLVTLVATCQVRAAAIRALDASGVRWHEAFTGGGMSAVLAAVNAGLGIAALGRNVRPAGAVELAEKDGLPPLPDGAVVLRSRISDPSLNRALREIVAAVKEKA